MYESCGVDNGDFLKCYNIGIIPSKKIGKNYSIFFIFFHSSKKQKITKCMEVHTFLSVLGFPCVLVYHTQL
jgi:hypothetical protein